MNDCSFISGALPSEQTKTCIDGFHVGRLNGLLLILSGVVRECQTDRVDVPTSGLQTPPAQDGSTRVSDTTWTFAASILKHDFPHVTLNTCNINGERKTFAWRYIPVYLRTFLPHYLVLFGHKHKSGYKSIPLMLVPSFMALKWKKNDLTWRETSVPPYWQQE